jgi:hypothetical protein
MHQSQAAVVRNTCHAAWSTGKSNIKFEPASAETKWVILIYYPDNAGGKSTNSKFTGTKEEAAGAACHKINNCLREKKRKALLPPSPARRMGRPPGSKNRT